MSYILDALRRAEAQRQRGAVPGLHAQPLLGGLTEPAPDRPSEAWQLVRGAALAVGLVLVALAGWWLWPIAAPSPVASAAAPAPTLAADPAPSPPALAVAAPLPAPARPVRVPPPQAPLQASGPAPALHKPAAPVPLPLPRPMPAPPASVAAARLPTLAELPEAQRREVGSLSLGGAVYADQPSMRMVILNGQVFHEGDRLAPDLVVQQIGLKSVVLALRGQRFELPL